MIEWGCIYYISVFEFCTNFMILLDPFEMYLLKLKKKKEKDKKPLSRSTGMVPN